MDGGRLRRAGDAWSGKRAALGEKPGVPFFGETCSSADFGRTYGKMKETD